MSFRLISPFQDGSCLYNKALQVLSTQNYEKTRLNKNLTSDILMKPNLSFCCLDQRANRDFCRFPIGQKLSFKSLQLVYVIFTYDFLQFLDIKTSH